MRSLKKISYLAFICVVALLVFVIILSFRQFQLTERHNKIISQSETALFEFATIREQITTALIEKNWQEVAHSADQLKNLSVSLARLQENTLIPGEYRLDMAKQVDLSGLTILSKDIVAAQDKIAHSRKLQERLRTLSDYLMQFDRIIVSQIRAKVVQFQTAMIGALGTVICLISFALILLYKKTLIPLLNLAKQSENPDVITNGFHYDRDACTEVAQLTDSVNELFKRTNVQTADEQKNQPHDSELAAIINESTNLTNGIINYAQLLADSYREVEIGAEETKIVQNIITAAERIAELNKKI